MKSNLYIPKTITVGFQTRGDTFTGKLAYVIYTDHKGVLRKEASWNSWRNKDIEVLTLDNVATPGFTLNKGVKRDGYWGSGRSVIRVWDPRDFEFEISVDNLIGILMHADVSKRDITEPCVFAWNGTELLLLPTNSLEYQESVAYTEKQEKKFSAKDLTVGYSYTARREDNPVVYLGRFDRYDFKRVYAGATADEPDPRYGTVAQLSLFKKPKKAHVFIDPITKQTFVKDPASFLSNVELEEMHPDYAALMDHYYLSVESQPIKGLKVVAGDSWSPWHALNDTDFVSVRFDNYGHAGGERYRISTFARFDPSTGAVEFSYDAGRRSYYSGSTYNARNLPGLSPTMPEVKALLDGANQMFDAHLAGIVRTDWAAYSAATTAAKHAIHEHFKLGNLYYDLADGKISTDHI